MKQCVIVEPELSSRDIHRETLTTLSPLIMEDLEDFVAALFLFIHSFIRDILQDIDFGCTGAEAPSSFSSLRLIMEELTALFISFALKVMDLGIDSDTRLPPLPFGCMMQDVMTFSCFET